MASLGFAVIGGGLGAIITILMFGGLGAGTTGMITGMLMTMGFSVEVGAFMSELFADC